jgi:hypothetical protein
MHRAKQESKMQNWRSSADVATAESLIMQLAGVCNGAASHDSLGFSKMDTSFGHSLAERARSGRAWTVKQAAAALKLITKYSKQLGGKDQIASWMQAPNFANLPAAPVEKKPARLLSSEDQSAVFQFEYNQDIIRELKTLRGDWRGQMWRAMWNHDQKQWMVPVNQASIFGIMKIARDWEFEIEPRFESYYSQICAKMESMKTAARESEIAVVLGAVREVVVEEHTISVCHENPAVLAEFQSALAAS